MKRLVTAGVALAALCIHVPVEATRPPSAYVRCDGLPDNVTAGETAARLLGAVTLLGLFAPAHEAPDASQRLAGAEGLAACNEALASESNDIRRVQLIQAIAIHHIEAGHYDEAIAAARQSESDRPAFTATSPFRLSMHLSALEIEALALAAGDHVDEAVTKALEMAAAAPYDLNNQLRALRYVHLAARFGPAEQRFYENLVRLYPAAVVDRAVARAMAGDFQGAAEDYRLWLDVERSTIGKPEMVGLANAALIHALAGDAARAEELAGQAREALHEGETTAYAPVASEILDLYQIWKTAHEGRTADARLLFVNRASWLRPSAAAVAEVARQLRQGLPADVTGPLAADPAHYRTELLARRLSEVKDVKTVFRVRRGFYSQSSYDHFGGNVWRAGQSRYLANADNDRLHARMVNVARDGYGTPANYALLLHSALAAQAQGKQAFMFLPGQTSNTAAFVRFGNPGDENLIAPLSLDAARVIADLGPVIPRPAAH
jgi:hypothetical protein